MFRGVSRRHPNATSSAVLEEEEAADAHATISAEEEGGREIAAQNEQHHQGEVQRPETYHAHQVVRELYTRYLKQQERYRGYRNLFVFLGFMALFMAILFTQRQANASFQVHRTLSDVLVPEDDVMGNVNQLHRWLRGVFQNVWVDPPCGDGVCDDPYEFPEYSRFGCRADCGLLKEIQNLTQVRISIQHDFSHPSSSIPAAELMQQTSWNLCPTVGTDVAFSRGCYYAQDKTFNSLSGTFSEVLDDVPDGSWNLIMRRDIFRKTSGSIMDYSKVLSVSYYYRVYVAAVTAMAEQNTEILMLEAARDFIGNPNENSNSNRRSMLSSHMAEDYTPEFFPWLKEEISNAEEFGGGLLADKADFYLQSFVNATCGCWDVRVAEDSDKTFGDADSVNNTAALPLLLEPFALGYNPIATKEELNNRICTPAGVDADTVRLYEPVDGPWEKQDDDKWAPAGNPNLNVLEEVSEPNKTRVCQAMYDFGLRMREKHTDVVRKILVDQRLGDQRTRGKIAARVGLRDSLRSSIETNQRELFEPIFISPTGSFVFGNDETGNPYMPRARLSLLQTQFVRGEYNVTPPVSLQLTRRAIYEEQPLATIPQMYERATARIAEVKQIQEQLLNIPVPPDASTSYPKNIKVRDVIQGFAAALNLDINGVECEKRTEDAEFKPCMVLDLGEGYGTVVISNNTVPNADHPAFATVGTRESDVTETDEAAVALNTLSVQGKSGLAVQLSTFDENDGVQKLDVAANFYDTKSSHVQEQGIRTAYVMERWDGGKDAYLRLRLEPDSMHPNGRGPQYKGTCQVHRNLTCENLAPQQEAEFMKPFNCTDSDGYVEGDLGSEDYRRRCEMPCTRQRDCSALCYCTEDCRKTQGIGGYCECKACTDLPLDATTDKSFQDLVSDTNTKAGKTKENIALNLVEDSNSRRSLLQDLDTTELLQQISAIKKQQAQITKDMSSLTSQVDISNQLASERANDNPVLAIIREVRQIISSGQDRVEARLDEILGRQSRSLEVAQRSTDALNSIRGLAERQVEAQRSLQSTVDRQLSAIQSKIDAGSISAQEALYEWKRTRRNSAVDRRRNLLATKVVNKLPTADNVFEMDNGNKLKESVPRERNVGLTNRVIAGMLLHQVRTEDVNCTDSKFFKIQESCAGPRTIASYGTDPVFKRGTQLFNPDFDDAEQELLVQFYNCSKLSNPTYNITFDTQIANQPPFCAELYSTQDLPYAFHHFPLEEKEPGFPVFFDINLSESEAQKWNTYLEEGLYIDQHTKLVTAQLMTYNAPLRVFGYFEVNFVFSEGGSIQVNHRLDTVRTELYCTSAEEARYAFEIVLSAWIYIMMLKNLWKIVQTQRREGNFLKFFLSGWNWTELVSNGLLTACISIWWHFVVGHQRTFDLELRHNVYETLVPQANYLALSGDGSNMVDLWADFTGLIDVIETLDLYFALGGINILLLMVRMLKLMDFQPRLGVVTRSLWLAGPDLIHFAFVFFMVFVGYAMLAHLIFGNAIEKFQTFDNSVNTCFEILLGEISVNEQLRDLGGLQAIAGAFFFWTYMLLVFMVLLNFLLAIIVDAFSEVKEQTHETVGIHTELYQLGREKLHSIMSLVRPNYIADTKVEAMLKQWAVGEQDVKDKEKPETSLKLLTVMNEDLDEKDLELVLLQCLKDAPKEEEEDPEKEKTFKERLLSCLPGRRKLKANEAQVEQAARFIVDRFGIPTVVEEEEEEEADESAGLRDALRTMRERARHEALARGEQGGQDARGGVDKASYERLIRERDDALRRCEQLGGGAGPSSSPAADAAVLEAAERDQLAAALDRLSGVQRLLADSQATLIADQQRLAQLVAQINAERKE
uniref:Polycystin cation channel PKD1/PKD2 domain-containing protein n=1 Tax=Dunaliella tertiolecta TaxID=3047 RepID=A0A6S8IGD5_DUNTE|mmetsp:Transcript_26793/g.72332  ORF Transcript_26793/g.72332 Transcript_26793/m.72332 type:complete len:1842 (+) Transcript_26793:92-5617(+)